MTNKDISPFKKLILKKIEEILNQEKIGKDIIEIKIDISWNVYKEPIITTTSTAMHIDVIEAESEET